MKCFPKITSEECNTSWKDNLIYLQSITIETNQAIYTVKTNNFHGFLVFISSQYKNDSHTYFMTSEVVDTFGKGGFREPTSSRLVAMQWKR